MLEVLPVTAISLLVINRGNIRSPPISFLDLFGSRTVRPGLEIEMRHDL
jgi:hypothetical protein